MRNVPQKLHSARGETLVEVLAAIIVCTLSVLLLASCAMTAMRMNKTAQDYDDGYYDALNYAESRGGVTPDPAATAPASTPTATDGTVTVERTGYPASSVPVTYYGGSGVWSFAAPTPSPSPSTGP